MPDPTTGEQPDAPAIPVVAATADAAPHAADAGPPADVPQAAESAATPSPEVPVETAASPGLPASPAAAVPVDAPLPAVPGITMEPAAPTESAATEGAAALSPAGPAAASDIAGEAEATPGSDLQGDVAAAPPSADAPAGLAVAEGNEAAAPPAIAASPDAPVAQPPAPTTAAAAGAEPAGATPAGDPPIPPAAGGGDAAQPKVPEPKVPGSRLLLHLPAIYQTNAEEGAPNFVGRFLLAFEQILTGLEDGTGDGGLDGKIAALPRLFDADRAPAEFLEWLGGWVAMSLRADLDTFERREFIRRAVPLYQRRGTRRGLLEMIRIHTSRAHVKPGSEPLPPEQAPVVEIEETAPELRVGTSARVGHAAIGGGPPHTFAVRIWDPQLDAASQQRMRDVVTAIVEMEKPAHTVFTLHLTGPTLQIGVRSTIGKNTVLGSSTAAIQPGTAHV